MRKAKNLTTVSVYLIKKREEENNQINEVQSSKQNNFSMTDSTDRVRISELTPILSLDPDRQIIFSLIFFEYLCQNKIGRSGFKI